MVLAQSSVVEQRLGVGVSAFYDILAVVKRTRHPLQGPRPLATNSGRGSA